MKRRWCLVLSLGLLCLVVAAVGFWNTWWGRAIRGVSRLEVRNMSSSLLDDVVITGSDTRDRQHATTAQQLEPGETVRLDVRTSDLILVSVTWKAGGTPERFSDHGLACPGETYVISVLDGGVVKTEYKR